MANLTILHLSIYEQVWGNPQSDTHPYAPLASIMHGYQWNKVRSRKFASDISIEGVLEVIEYTWFQDDSLIISITRTAYSVTQRRKRVALHMFYTSDPSSQQSLSSPDYTLLADDCTVCNLCSSDICICPDSVASPHNSHSDCFIIHSALPDESQAEAHFFVDTWEDRYRMITRGTKRGLLTVLFNPFSTMESQPCLTMRQEFISIFQDQHSLSSRIEQHITGLLSKLPQMQTSLSATPAFCPSHPSFQPPRSSLPHPDQMVGSNALNKTIPSLLAPSTSSPATSNTSAYAPLCKITGSGNTPPLPVLPTHSPSDTPWLRDDGASPISTLRQQRISKSEVPNSPNSHHPTVSLDTIAKSNDCSRATKNVHHESLAFLLNSRGARFESENLAPNSVPPNANVLHKPVPTAPVQATLVGKLAKKCVVRKDNGTSTSLLGTIDSNSSAESTACDPLSFRSGVSRCSSLLAVDGSPLKNSNPLSGEHVNKRPRTDPNARSDFSFSVAPNSWSIPRSSDDRSRELPLPSWSLASLPDPSISALGRALGTGRSPSPFGMMGSLLKTPSMSPRTPNLRNDITGSVDKSDSKQSAIQSAEISPAIASLPPLRAITEGASIAQTDATRNELDTGAQTDLEPQAEWRHAFSSSSEPHSGNELTGKNLHQGGMAAAAAAVIANAGGRRMSCNDGGDSSLSCEICGITFAKKGNKLRHILTVHNRLKQFECDQCGAKFGLKADLGRHKHRIHESRSFTCESCGKSFAEESQLEFHVRTHKNLVPWECKQCNMRFGRKSSLTRHEQTVHEHARFVCRVCKKSYSQRFDAIRHERKVHGLDDKCGGLSQKNDGT